MPTHYSQIIDVELHFVKVSSMHLIKGAFGWPICHPKMLTSKILVPVLWDFEKRNLVTFWVYQCFMSKKIFGYFFWVFFII